MKNLQLTLIATLVVATASFSLAHAKPQTPNIGSIQSTEQEIDKNDRQANKLKEEAKNPLMFCKGFPLCHDVNVGGNKEEVQPVELFNAPTKS